MKRIAVLGTGANGSCVAADLTRVGLDVTLIDQWPAHVEAMKTDGVTISLPAETLRAGVRAEHLCDVCSFNETYDIVFLMVKAFDTRCGCWRTRSWNLVSSIVPATRPSFGFYHTMATSAGLP